MTPADTDGLIWHDRPHLRNPRFVAAFEGWNDAAEAASDAAAWLVRAADATSIASIDPEVHIDFQARRPHVELLDGVTRRLRWPSNEFFAVPMPRAEHDLVVLLGCEPNYRWPSFCHAVIEVVTGCGCDSAFTFGALMGDSPHTRPTRITGTATDPEVIGRHGLEPSHYEGPTGIVGVLHDQLRRAGVPSVSLWATVPHYAAQAPNPHATRELLRRLDSILALGLPTEDLDPAIGQWRAQLDATIAADDDLTEYLHQLESQYDAEPPEPPRVLPDVPSADALAAEIERFLRDRPESSD